MWKGTTCVSSSWGGKPGGTAYGSQLEEWKAAGLDGFRMSHRSKVKQFSSMFSSFCIMSNGVFFLDVPFSFQHFHLLPWQCLSMSHMPLLSNLSCHTNFLLLGTLPAAGIPSQGYRWRRIFVLSFLRFNKCIVTSLPLWAVPCKMQVRLPLQDCQSIFLGGILFDLP